MAESADCSLMDRDFMQVVFTLAKAGHQQHVPAILERMRHERGYIPGTHILHITCDNLFIMQDITGMYVYDVLEAASLTQSSASNHVS